MARHGRGFPIRARFKRVLRYPQAFSYAPTDSLTITELISTRSVGRVFSDALTMAENFTPVRILVSTLTDTLTMADSILKAVGRTLSDALTMSDGMTTIATMSRTFTDALTMTDTILKAIGRTFGESITMADSLVRSIGKTLADSMTMTDTFIRDAARAFSDTLTITATFISATAKTFIETITMGDGLVAGFLNYVRRTPFIGGSKSSAGGQTGKRTDIGSTGTRYE